eukprot:m.102480 g.102480  ORF g.102480 m.102480 type:complete len:571 (+) comp10438_c1_seq1:250-1962(+)
MSLSGANNSAQMSSLVDKQRARILQNQRARRSGGIMQSGGVSPRKNSNGRGGVRRLTSDSNTSETTSEPAQQPVHRAPDHELEEVSLEWVQRGGSPRRVGDIPTLGGSGGNDNTGNSSSTGRRASSTDDQRRVSDASSDNEVPIFQPLEKRASRNSDTRTSKGPTSQQLELASELGSQGIGVVYEPTAQGGSGRSANADEFYRSSADRATMRSAESSSLPRSAPPPYDQIVDSSDPNALASANPTPIAERPDDEAAAERAERQEAAAAAANASNRSPVPLVRQLSPQAIREELMFGIEGYPSLLDFVVRPTPEGVTVQCEISRSKSRKSTYILKLERPEVGGVQKVFLLAGKKRNRPGTNSNYLVSCDPNDMKKESEAYCAKVKANMMGTEFTIYDSGLNPRKAEKGRGAGREVRKELGLVKYDRNVFGWSGPRQMIVILPALNEHQIPYVVQPKSQRDTISTKFEQGRTADLLQFTNKEPQWKDRSTGEYTPPPGKEPRGSYVLDFGGRVTEPSIKNFQIIFGNELDYIVCQFGRTGKDTFSMDVNYPMSIVQAFGLCLTSFDWKPGCE